MTQIDLTITHAPVPSLLITLVPTNPDLSRVIEGDVYDYEIQITDGPYRKITEIVEDWFDGLDYGQHVRITIEPIGSISLNGKHKKV